MKKLLILLFSTFFLFLSGTNVWAAQGVDCADIKTPDLSGIDYRLTDEKVYQERHLGKSLNYEYSAFDFLTYYSFDGGADFIDQEVLDSQLASAVGEIFYRYSSGSFGGRSEYPVNVLNYELQDDARYLNIKAFNEVGMQKFINQGVLVTAIEINSQEPIKIIEIVTVGTDGYCIHKVRWTTLINPEIESLPNNQFLEYFESLLIDFYRLFIKIN
jgi:hypothetical protein